MHNAYWHRAGGCSNTSSGDRLCHRFLCNHKNRQKSRPALTIDAQYMPSFCPLSQIHGRGCHKSKVKPKRVQKANDRYVIYIRRDWICQKHSVSDGFLIAWAITLSCPVRPFRNEHFKTFNSAFLKQYSLRTDPLEKVTTPL